MLSSSVFVLILAVVCSSASACKRAVSPKPGHASALRSELSPANRSDSGLSLSELSPADNGGRQRGGGFGDGFGGPRAAHSVQALAGATGRTNGSSAEEERLTRGGAAASEDDDNEPWL